MRKQETRKGKKVKRVRKNRSRRHTHTKRCSHKHSSHRRHRLRGGSHRLRGGSHRLRGGSYAKDFTEREVDGMPYTEKAVVVAGQYVMKAKDLQQHADYLDRQGSRT